MASEVPEIPEVPVVALDYVENGIRNKSIIILDVRKPDELITKGKIPSSLNLPVNDIESAMELPANDFKSRYGFDKPTPNGEQIVVHCGSGGRAGRAGKIFRDQFGFADVVNYAGGWGEWSKKYPEHAKGAH